MSCLTPPTMTIPPSQHGEPAWEIALLFPPQGHWSEAEYLALDTNRLVELVNGRIEVLPMPSAGHQLIVIFLVRWLQDFVKLHKLGVVLCAPFPVKIRLDTFREPDVLFLRPGRIPNSNARSVIGADLAIEIVSEGAENRKRDLETKPVDYAEAGVSEYWIVDPETQTVTVLTLDGTAYREHGVFRVGDTASSVLLRGLTLAVADAFAAARIAE